MRGFAVLLATTTLLLAQPCLADDDDAPEDVTGTRAMDNQDDIHIRSDIAKRHIMNTQEENRQPKGDMIKTTRIDSNGNVLTVTSPAPNYQGDDKDARNSVADAIADGDTVIIRKRD
jgi:hypothetical protein